MLCKLMFTDVSKARPSLLASCFMFVSRLMSEAERLYGLYDSTSQKVLLLSEYIDRLNYYQLLQEATYHVVKQVGS
jgi:hypothetical protein